MATNLAKENDLNAEQRLVTTKLRIINGVEQESFKKWSTATEIGSTPDRRRAGSERQSAVPEWAHSTVPKRGSGFKCPTCRTTNVTVQHSSDSRCTVLIALLVRQQWQRRRLPVRRARNKLEEALGARSMASLSCSRHADKRTGNRMAAVARQQQ